MGVSLYINHLLKLALCIAFAMSSVVFAHNDMSADVRFEALFDSSGFIGVRNHWTFEEEYSAQSMSNVDVNGNGILDDGEVPLLQKLIVDSLRVFNYDNYVLSGARFLDAQGITDFKASLKSGCLTIDFTVVFFGACGERLYDACHCGL